MTRSFAALVLVGCGAAPKAGAPETGTTPTTPVSCHADLAIDEGDDGSVDVTGVDTYDPTGEWIVTSTLDEDLDGTDDIVDSYVRDADGRVLHYESRWGGVLEAQQDSTWTATGRPASDEWFVADDGTGHPSDTTFTYTYDGDDHLIELDIDRDTDGAIDASTTWTVDADGRHLTDATDFDGDGLVDETGAYSYDDQGRQIAYDQTLIDGTPSESTATVYTDPVLLVGATAVDSGADGVADYALGFGYDAAGEQVYDASDYHLDVAGWDLEKSFTWVDGRVTHVHYADYTGMESDEDRTYDDHGRLVEQVSGSVDAAGASAGGTRSTWTFSDACP